MCIFLRFIKENYLSGRFIISDVDNCSICMFVCVCVYVVFVQSLSKYN